MKSMQQELIERGVPKNVSSVYFRYAQTLMRDNDMDRDDAIETVVNIRSGMGATEADGFMRMMSDSEMSRKVED